MFFQLRDAERNGKGELRLGPVGLSRSWECRNVYTGSVAPRELFPSALFSTNPNHLFCEQPFFSLPFMSHAHPTASSSFNYQLIINNALNAYKKRTKNDLTAHPLVAQLQSCNSPSSILAVLQQQLQGLDQSRRSDERWTRWLDPTVNVLYTLSATLGEGVGLVCAGEHELVYHLILSGRCFRPRKRYLPGSESSSQCVSFLMTPWWHCNAFIS